MTTLSTVSRMEQVEKKTEIKKVQTVKAVTAIILLTARVRGKNRWGNERIRSGKADKGQDGYSL